MKNNLSSLPIEAIGWTLLHSLWQGAALAALLWLALRFLRIQRPNLRYGIACSALVLMAGATGLTFHSQYEYPIAAPETSLSQSLNLPELQATASDGGETSSTPAPSSIPILTSKSTQPLASTQSAFPWMTALVAFWACGVALFSLRFLCNWHAVHRLRTRSTTKVDPVWQERFSTLRRQLGITRQVSLLSSSCLTGPVALGWLRPTVMIPLGLFTGLSARQVEAILVHELAHIRRHDYLINLLQNVLETLFFYHPAVWWISSLIREEREHCCDDIAAAHCGNPVVYAKALTSLEMLRPHMPAFALAATGSTLLTRVRRLLGDSPTTRSTRGLLPASLITAAIIFAVTLSWLKAEPEERDEIPDLAQIIETSDAPKTEIVDALLSRKTILKAQTEEQASELKYGLLNPQLREIRDEIREINQALEPLLKAAQTEDSEFMRIINQKSKELIIQKQSSSLTRGKNHPEMLAIVAMQDELERLRNDFIAQDNLEISREQARALIELRLERAGLSHRYGANHPVMKKIEAELALSEQVTGITTSQEPDDQQIDAPANDEQPEEEPQPVEDAPHNDEEPAEEPHPVEDAQIQTFEREVAELRVQDPKNLTVAEKRSRIAQFFPPTEKYWVPHTKKTLRELEQANPKVSKEVLSEFSGLHVHRIMLMASGLGEKHPKVIRLTDRLHAITESEGIKYD